MAAPRILVTNDDGITSPGLHALYRALAALGEVTMVAPDAERSAVGHAITTLTPLRAKPFRFEGADAGYAINGTPADCVKLAVGILLPQPPDLVVSGINLGPNTATNIIYSGTVSAATEARILGIPSIAVSIATFTEPRWETAAGVAGQVAAAVLERGLPDKVLLNVNVPNLEPDGIRGWKVTRQGDSQYEGAFVDRTDPRQVPYYWSAGQYVMSDTDPDTDAKAVADGYISVTPVTFDLTAHALLGEVAGWLPATTSPAREAPG